MFCPKLDRQRDFSLCPKLDKGLIYICPVQERRHNPKIGLDSPPYFRNGCRTDLTLLSGKFERKLKMNLEFFMPMDPPTATAQEKQVRIIHGKPVFYEPQKVRYAHMKLLSGLREHKPEEPLTGPIELTVVWRFPKGTRHKDGEFKISKPDTDNLQKLLKDCMTEVGFWKDDAQVCREQVMKLWTDDPPGIVIGVHELKPSVYELDGWEEEIG